ncbi:flagellar basal body-associated FliL family protein [Thalassomonas viridans]|uniref:Flagellar protein FliL n=1 Tax=Thalassomonas viridans TaxID=137584 RepID=A0AAE9Z4W6_9GAMM|nr:flagellar basal body-associated FliL family protein [Thalassomonas viridans]WDE05192.1 flagellar basal body-associated FliL family protein [Thalassomonas viridans]
MKSKIQGKTQVIVITILATLIIVAGLSYAGVNFGSDMLKSFSQPQTDEQNRPLYYPLEKLVISVESDKVIYYMMMEVSLETHDEPSLSQIRHFLPVIRNHFVKDLSQRNFQSMRGYLKDLTSLQQELHESLRQVLEKYQIPDVVDDVLITKLVIQ